MKEIFIEDKQKYLEDNHPCGPIPELDHEMVCIHCGKLFKVGDYKVIEEDGFAYISCPDAPECDGTAIDWIVLDQIKPKEGP